jgi:superfamily I DNA and/or RNA helicase
MLFPVQGQVGFLDDWRRMNVAITRAKRAMVLVGNERTLCAGDEHWRGLLESLEARGCVLRGSRAAEALQA